MKEKTSPRRKILKGLGFGVGGALIFGSVSSLFGLFAGAKGSSLLVFRRRSAKPGVPSRDSIFYPRDPEVRRKMAEQGPGAV